MIIPKRMLTICTWVQLILFVIFHVDVFFADSQILASSSPTSQRQAISEQPFRPGDAVQISVYPDSTSFLHRIFPIDGEGYIFLPIVGKKRIIGMTQSQFIEYLEQDFEAYLKTPNIQIRPLIRASALGGFARPNLYYIDPNATLWDLVQMAGGTVTEDGLKKMKWERNGKEFNFDLLSSYQAGRSLTQMGFRSGDQIWTPSLGKPSMWSKMLPIISVGVSFITLYYWYVSLQLQYERY
jgi:protein involved in polysaccharide export with SLBB domain